MAWVPYDQEEEAWPLGMLKASWGISLNTWWVLLKTRVSQPSLNQTQLPAKLNKANIE